MEKAATPLFNNEDILNPSVEITIQKEAVNQLPLGRYQGRIELIDDTQKLDAALEALSHETILGFDTESRPVFRRGQSSAPSLLQLAGSDRVWLFQLKLIGDLGELFDVLADPNVLKTGVAIRDDIRKLNELHEFTAGGFVEISDLTQKTRIVNTGLRNLAALFLGFRISKGAQVSNWARKDLTPAQIRYAATDAWVSRELYLKLIDLDLVTEDRTTLAS